MTCHLHASTAGNFGLRSAGGDGYSHSVVVIADVSSNAAVRARDRLRRRPTASSAIRTSTTTTTASSTTCSTRSTIAGSSVAVWNGGRSNTVTGEATSFYEITGGINYKPHANVVDPAGNSLRLVARPTVKPRLQPRDLRHRRGRSRSSRTVQFDERRQLWKATVELASSKRLTS